MKNRYIRVFTFFFLLSSLLFLTPQPTHALVRRKLTTKVAAPVINRGSVGTVGMLGRLRSDRRALILSITGLNNTESVSYLFTYYGSGQNQGAQGVIRPTEGIATSRELLFGTCSHGVCTYHNGIKDARLEVTAKLKNGKTTIKRYKIRV